MQPPLAKLIRPLTQLSAIGKISWKKELPEALGYLLPVNITTSEERYYLPPLPPPPGDLTESLQDVSGQK